MITLATHLGAVRLRQNHGYFFTLQITDWLPNHTLEGNTQDLRTLLGCEGLASSHVGEKVRIAANRQLRVMNEP